MSMLIHFRFRKWGNAWAPPPFRKVGEAYGASPNVTIYLHHYFEMKSMHRKGVVYHIISIEIVWYTVLLKSYFTIFDALLKLYITSDVLRYSRSPHWERKTIVYLGWMLDSNLGELFPASLPPVYKTMTYWCVKWTPLLQVIYDAWLFFALSFPF